jgi:hypothetical protein
LISSWMSFSVKISTPSWVTLPLQYCYSSFTDSLCFLFLFTVSIETPSNVTWIKINCHQKGYYRVNYDEQDWKNLIELLKNDRTVREQYTWCGC